MTTQATIYPIGDLMAMVLNNYTSQRILLSIIKAIFTSLIQGIPDFRYYIYNNKDVFGVPFRLELFVVKTKKYEIYQIVSLHLKTTLAPSLILFKKFSSSVLCPIIFPTIFT